MHPIVSLSTLTPAFLSCLIGAASSFANDHNAPLRIEQVSISGNTVALEWGGGTSPYFVETSNGFGDWSTAAETNKRSAVVEVLEGTVGEMYVRVKASPAPKLGDYLGQLRVDEGEFGGRLARHRLKSLWDFYLPGGAEPSNIPAEYLQSLIANITYREGNELAYFTGKLGDLPGGEISLKDSEIQVRWNFDEETLERRYTLTLAFRYPIDSQRAGEIHLSDPQCTLQCSYSATQPEVGFEDGGFTIIETRDDEVSLYQLHEESGPVGWWNRDYDLTIGDVQFSTGFLLGVPLLEGGPAFIWKTPILRSWQAPTVISGITSQPIIATDRFSQTYDPGHHNFVESFWIEPVLIPGITDETLDELQSANIRFIVPTNPSAFPESKPTLRVVGFDNVLRDYP